MESQLESYTTTDIGGSSPSDNESHVLELKLKALILDAIHAIDVVQQLIKVGVKSLDNWAWQKQLRFYLQKSKFLCIIFFNFPLKVLNFFQHSYYPSHLKMACFVHFFSLLTEVCVMRMVDAQFNYTYEYQGNASKLVHTPLTDKCYLTLTQGMHVGLGGNPYGPAGTGKTESVKALGGLFGRQVLVFNCDEVINLAALRQWILSEDK